MPNRMEVNGWPVRWTMVPADRLGVLEPLWRDMLGRATPDPVFRSYLEGHEAALPADEPWIRSIVVAATWFPPRRLAFSWGGARRSIIQPPAYYTNALSRARLKEALAAELGNGVPARLEDARTPPLKLLAASCGLGAYGRNNIVYVDGFGSALSLAAFWTDAAPVIPEADAAAPIYRDPYPGPAALPDCASCGRCVARCPTRAIPTDFGLLDAGRCLSLWNETDRDLPAFVPTDAPNVLTGCGLCQRECPANASAWSAPLEIPELAEAETGLVLSGAWSPGLREILSRLVVSDDTEELEHWAPVLRRNLASFIASNRMS